MAGLTIKHKGSADEMRSFSDKGQLELYQFEKASIGLYRMKPGWRWSEQVQPKAGTSSCEVSHFGYCVSGRLKVVMDDGEEGEIGPGDSFQVAPGHDSYVVGDEDYVGFDVGEIERYGMRAHDLRAHELIREEPAPPPAH